MIMNKNKKQSIIEKLTMFLNEKVLNKVKKRSHKGLEEKYGGRRERSANLLVYRL